MKRILLLAILCYPFFTHTVNVDACCDYLEAAMELQALFASAGFTEEVLDHAKEVMQYRSTGSDYRDREKLNRAHSVLQNKFVGRIEEVKEKRDRLQKQCGLSIKQAVAVCPAGRLKKVVEDVAIKTDKPATNVAKGVGLGQEYTKAKRIVAYEAQQAQIAAERAAQQASRGDIKGAATTVGRSAKKEGKKAWKRLGW